MRYSTNNDFSTLTAEELDKHYMVNVRATTLLSSQFSEDLIRNLVVELLILLRGNFKITMAGELAYATTKGAIDALTSTLSAEVAHLGITVNAINPG